MPKMHGAIFGDVQDVLYAGNAGTRYPELFGDVQDVRYGEAGMSPGQSAGVAPAERRARCEGQMQVPSTWYPVRGTRSFLAMSQQK